MRVWILPSWYFKEGSEELQGRMFHAYARSLMKSGIDASIVYAQLNQKQPLKKHEAFKMEEGVPTWRIRKFAIPKINRVAASVWRKQYVNIVLEIIKKHGRPDLIHAQSYLAGSVAAGVKKKTGIPFIVTERLSDFLVDGIPARYRNLIRKTFNSADRITSVSPGLKNHLQRFTAKDIDVIPNYFDRTLFHCNPDIKKNEKFTWVSIGEPAHTKGLDILLHAFGKLKAEIPSFQMELMLIDDIKEKPKLMKIVEQYNLAGDVKWTGLVTQHQLGYILRSSHALISASRVESFGKAIMEALACGIPVIATKTDGGTYILENDELGILSAPNDVDALKDAMHLLLKQYDNYKSDSISASAEKRFNEEIVIDMWKKLYAEVLV